MRKRLTRFNQSAGMRPIRLLRCRRLRFERPILDRYRKKGQSMPAKLLLIDPLLSSKVARKKLKVNTTGDANGREARANRCALKFT
jgi:hypothetical protein